MRFAGYAAVFGRVDRGGDVVLAGAFARSLAAGGGAARVPLLWQHDPARPIGRIEYLREDGRGLRVIARLSAGRSGRAAAAALAAGRVAGLSFGYRVRAARGAAEGGGALRELSDVDLVEISLVSAPMQPKARVHAVERERDPRSG
jgi:HK97 family phage prohead protease